MKAKIISISIQFVLLVLAIYFYLKMDTPNLKILWIGLYFTIAICVWATYVIVISPPTNPNYDEDEDEEKEGPPPIPPEFSKRKIYEKEEELVC
ncbi:MAG: hypothetical protein KBD52_00225 [Candidatus Pacebacteria bacterium]|nr:hypothetical protein [Candidatus Paceibacterota bacterium]